jgi:hypothetical protein
MKVTVSVLLSALSTAVAVPIAVAPALAHGGVSFDTLSVALNVCPPAAASIVLVAASIALLSLLHPPAIAAPKTRHETKLAFPNPFRMSLLLGVTKGRAGNRPRDEWSHIVRPNQDRRGA